MVKCSWQPKKSIELCGIRWKERAVKKQLKDSTKRVLFTYKSSKYVAEVFNLRFLLALYSSCYRYDVWVVLSSSIAHEKSARYCMAAAKYGTIDTAREVDCYGGDHCKPKYDEQRGNYSTLFIS